MGVIVPEIFADAVNETLGVSLRVGQLATDYTGLVEDIETCGDTVHFPVIDRITDAAVVTKGTPLEPDEVSMSDASAEIKQVAKSVRIYDKDSAQVKGELKDLLAKQLGQSMAKSVDADLVNSIRTDAAFKNSNVETLTEDEVDKAFEPFGDDLDNDTFAGILINSRLRGDFMRMDAFVNVTKTRSADGNGIVRDGIIGYWNGSIPIVMANNGTYDSSGKKSLLAVIKKGALGLVWQKTPSTEEERESKLLATDLVASEMYATKLIHTDGVSILEVSDPV